MRFLLDTNICIRYLNGRSPTVFERLNALPESDIAVCSIVKFELRYGALRSDYVEKTLEKQETFLNRYVSLPLDNDLKKSAFLTSKPHKTEQKGRIIWQKES